MPFATALRFLQRPWGKQAFRLRSTGASISAEAPPAGSALLPNPRVVLLHGLGGDQEDWREVAEHLPAHWSVMVLDFRGHGRSGAPEQGFVLDDLADDLLALLTSLGSTAEPTWLIGYGVGGMVALRAADRVTQAGPSAAPPNVPESPEAPSLSPAATGGVAGPAPSLSGLVLIETFSTQRAAAAFRPGRYDPKIPPERRRKITTKYQTTRERFHVSFYDQFWASVIFFDGRPFLAATELPLHTVYGSVGRYPATQKRLELPDRPNLHLHWLEKSGHYLLHERPADLAAVCRRAIEPVLRPDAPDAN